MNGNFRHAELHLSLGLFCVAASVTVSSRGQEFAPSGSDPLRVDPQVLHQGVRLPGDSQAPGCTESLSRDQPLDLERAASFALCNSPKARATWEAIEVQAGVLGEAKAAYLPSVVSSLTVQRERNLFPGESALDDSKTGHSAYVNGSWRVFDFGGRAANRESAEHLLSAALATHDAKLQEILDAVIAAYFDAVTAKAELEASQRTRSLASDTFAATGRREGKGAASHNDTLQAQVALEKSLLAEKKAFGTYSRDLAVLGYTMGLTPNATFSLPSLENPPLGTIGELNQWLEVAEAQHPALVAAREEWAAMTRKVTATRSEGRPTLDFTANLFVNGYPNQGFQTTPTRQTTFGLTVTVPLFEGFARAYKVQEAVAQARGAEAQYKDREYQVLMVVVKAHADAVSALGNLDSSEALLSAGRAAEESSERRYASGATSILELLTSQSNLADAEQQRVQCLSEWYAARLRLWTSAGTLGLTRLKHPLIPPEVK